MAAGDAAVMQLAQAFTTLARSAAVGSDGLRILSAPVQSIGARLVKMDNALGTFSKGVTLLSVGFSKLTKSLAAVPLEAWVNLTSTFSMISQVAQRFVGALNPAMVEQLQLAFDDLFAVVGRLFTPIMAALVPIVRTFADALVPVVQQLMPTFKLLADAIMGIAGPAIAIFSGLLVALAPQFEMLAGWLKSLAELIGQNLFQYIDALVPLFAGMLDAVGMLMPSILELAGALTGMAIPLAQIIVPILIPAFRLLADVVARVISALSWLIGKGAEGLRMLAPAPLAPGLKVPDLNAGASRGAASKGAQFQGFADFGAQLMQASFGSSVNTPEFKTAENTAKIADGIDKLVEQGLQQRQAAAIGQPGRGKF